MARAHARAPNSRRTHGIARQVLRNPHSMPGSSLYRRFMQARCIASSLHSCHFHFSPSIAPQAYEETVDKRVELVFHGSPEANMPSLLSSGLDPARRRSGGALTPQTLELL